MKEEQISADGSQSMNNQVDNRAKPAEKSLLYIVMFLVLLLDFASKLLIETRLPLNVYWAPIPELADFFRITHVSNTGAAFGLFPTGSSLFMIVALVVSIIIIIYNQRLPANHQLYRIALGLQLGGAMGNLLDRFRQGYVTDFLDFGPWPIFNIADMSIVAGVLLLAFLMFREQSQESESAQVEPIEGFERAPEHIEPADDQQMLWND